MRDTAHKSTCITVSIHLAQHVISWKERKNVKIVTHPLRKQLTCPQTGNNIFEPRDFHQLSLSLSLFGYDSPTLVVDFHFKPAYYSN